MPKNVWNRLRKNVLVSPINPRVARRARAHVLINAQSQSSYSKSLSLERMSDEVCILKRQAELMTSIRVALMGKTVDGPAPMSCSSQRAELLQQGCGDRFLTVVENETNFDCGRRRRHTIAAPCSSFSGVFGALTNIDVPGANKRIVHIACAPNVYRPTHEIEGGHPKLLSWSESKATTLGTLCRLNTSRQTAARTRCP